MLAIGLGRFVDLADLSLAQDVDRTLAAEAGIAGQHEVDPHPRLLNREHLDDGAYAEK